MNMPIHKVPAAVARGSNGKKRERTLTTKWFFRVLEAAGWNPLSLEGKHVVHEEVTGMAGRVDIALKAGKRILACIELKAPNVEIDEFSLKQAVKYAASYYYVNDGRLDPVLAICTNGLDAYIMDPAIKNPHSQINYHHIDLRSEMGTKKLIDLFQIENIDRANGDLPLIGTQRKLDPRPYASNTTAEFESSIFKMAEDLCDLGYSAKTSVEMTVQVLLLAAGRDNGIIPNSVIRNCEAAQDWKGIARHCNRLFGDVFEQNLSGAKAKHIWELYNRTSNFKVRLDILPAQYMGTVYEKLIKKYFGNKTSFYTPEDMIDTVLAECKPLPTDSILDPTCGSGAFLSKAIDAAITGKVTPQKLLTFFSRVVGVDKDPIACKVAKVTLLCTFMRKVGEEYRRTGKPLPRPQIEPDVDFFDWEGAKFDLILGNPPWESIDELPAARKRQLENLSVYSVYQAKNDQLCYIVEKAISRHLKPKGRFGFVIKLQALLGTQYVNFVRFLDHKAETIFDYGRDQKFGNYAQSAGIVGRLGAKSWTYKRLTPEDTAELKNDGVRFGRKYDSTKGAESGADPIYRAFGVAHPTSNCVKRHPTNLGYGSLPGKTVPMAFIWKDNTPPDFLEWLDQNPALEKKLRGRADVKSSKRHPLSWRRNNTADLKGPILITERILTPGRERFPFFIDKNRSHVPLTGQTCISSLNEDFGELLDLAAMMASDYFVALCRACNLIPRRAGGVFLNPITIKSRLMIPAFNDQDRTALRETIQKAILEKRDATDEERESLNTTLSKYLSWGKQKGDADTYQVRLLSSFLQPEGVDENEDATSEEIQETIEAARATKKKTGKGQRRKVAR